MTLISVSSMLDLSQYNSGSAGEHSLPLLSFPILSIDQFNTTTNIKNHLDTTKSLGFNDVAHIISVLITCRSTVNLDLGVN